MTPKNYKIADYYEPTEASYTRMLNHLPGMAYRCVVQKDYEYKLVYVSRGCNKILGLTPEEALSSPTNTVERMTLAEDLATMRRDIHDAIVHNKSYNTYYRILTPQGKELWIWDQGEGVFDSNGHCIFLEGIMMDVTAQKRTEQKLKSENKQLRSSAPDNDRGLGRIIGKSAAMQKLYELIMKGAKSDVNVILYGETGVGKDLVAETIHKLSNLKGRYVPVNCAAIPEQLLESEFFGHVKGAFSGATSSRQGYLAAADGGTLFLDEIAELPLNLQVKLLRALENRSYSPVGSNEVKTSNFRLISATNRDLKAMVREQAMRADFFYRIHVLTVVIPPLRERFGDIPLLASAYAKSKNIDTPLPQYVLDQLNSYAWPGNVRELQNTLDRYWIFGQLDLASQANTLNSFSETQEQQIAPHLSAWADSTPIADTLVAGAPPPDPAHINTSRAYAGAEGLPPPATNAFIPPAYATGTPATMPLADLKEVVESKRIVEALELCGWKKGKAATMLGITIRTLQRKVKKYNIERWP